jgi:hypothetical protein
LAATPPAQKTLSQEPGGSHKILIQC